ncbi:MAG TPA: alpha/beta fold hydrolase [Thermomicrobiales bacterium]|jgi:pimeloyl-ACP methyl ester carboxylesterase
MATRFSEAAVNGTRLRYQLGGDGPPLVLLHGFALDLRMWDHQVAAFAPHYQVLRYDLRGFGGSALPGSSPYDHADDLRALLDYLGIGTAALVGLSMGGEVALDFAVTYPERLRALVLADAMIGGYRWSAEWQATTAPIWHAAREQGVTPAKARWLAHPGLFGAAREQQAVAATLTQMIDDYSGWHWRNRDPHRKPSRPAIEQLAQIATPTLIITGEREAPDFVAQANLLGEQIPGAQSCILPAAGHLTALEAPDAFNRAVLDFLDTTLPR